MSSAPKVKYLQLTSDQKLLAGLQANASSLPSFVLAGQTVTPAEGMAVFQARVDSGVATVTARGIYQSAVQANRKQIADTAEFASRYKTALQLALDNAPDKLAQYGMTPKKKAGPRTVLTKVVAQAKSASTRKARNTMGKRQKEKVKGAVPSTLTIDVGGGVASIGSAGTTKAPALTRSGGGESHEPGAT
jgi:hypothetical protein